MFKMFTTGIAKICVTSHPVFAAAHIFSSKTVLGFRFKLSL